MNGSHLTSAIRRLLAACLGALFVLQPIALAGPPCAARALFSSRNCCCVGDAAPEAKSCCSTGAPEGPAGPAASAPRESCPCKVGAPAQEPVTPKLAGDQGQDEMREISLWLGTHARAEALPMPPPPAADEGPRAVSNAPPALLERGARGWLALICVARL